MFKINSGNLSRSETTRHHVTEPSAFTELSNEEQESMKEANFFLKSMFSFFFSDF